MAFGFGESFSKGYWGSVMLIETDWSGLRRERKVRMKQ